MLQKKTFYMIRHGETVANAENYASGHMDTPLTDKGKNQARNMEGVFNDLKNQPDLIIHSPLSRAKDTALIVNKFLKLPMIDKENLSEQSFGDWQGVSWGKVRLLMSQENNPPNGEAMEVFYKRAMKGIREALTYTDTLPLIVTHGGVFDAFWSYYNIELIDVVNCGLYEFIPKFDNKACPWKVRHVK